MIASDFFCSVGSAHANDRIFRAETGDELRKEPGIFGNEVRDFVRATERAAITTLQTRKNIFLRHGKRGWRALAHGLFDLRNPVRPLEYFTRLRTIGRAYDAVLLHEIDQVCGASVADAQAALQQGSGRLAELHH